MNSPFKSTKFSLSTLSLIALMSSCSHIQMTSHAELMRKKELGLIASPSSDQSTVALNQETDPLENAQLDELEAIDVEQEASESKLSFNPLRLFQKSEPKEDELPLEKNKHAKELKLSYHEEHFEFWVNYYLTRNKERFERQLSQGEAFRDIVSKVFKEHGLPEELFYVGLIESGYSMHIRSHAAAVGPWQFIKGTATRYGMRVNSQIDERTNIHKASVAAAGYFRDLYNIFGSWELALCAYNAGEYRIINAIRKGNTRDYNELVRKKLIPKETIQYVPKLAAARYLSDNRSKYKINVASHRDDFYINASEAVIKGTFSLEDISKKVGVSLSDLKKLNPDLKHETISAPRTGQRIIVPNTKLAQAQGLSFSHRRAVAQSDDDTLTGKYRVRRGDNLSRIAAKHRTSVAQLRRLNNIRGSRILVGQTLRVPTTNIRTYKVRRGDNLTRIAQRFKTTVPRIVEMNSLRGTRIFPNQTINIPGDS